MLFACSADFFAAAKRQKKLPRESEKEYARRMAEGDGEARKQIMLSYLPEVAAFAGRRTRGEAPLELIYRLVAALEKAVDAFDFQQEREAFSRTLSRVMRKTLTEYIADK
jgi:DNA-directed RNA polymerase sigma subunit (sigma70/sigma32)